MPCPALHTGERLLATAMVHIDCQAQVIGSYGYGALADPGSAVAVTLTSLLTIFIAIFGLRLLLGYPMAGRDLVGDIVKVGIVLTLATSWPAWRVLGYDLVLDGPADIARSVGLASQLPGASGDMVDRLQAVDDGLAMLNAYGSGRLTNALGDWFQLGMARSVFLAGALGPLALIRLVAGILIAIAPLMAGLLLFGITRPVFAGWCRGLVMSFLGSLVLTVIQGVQIAVLEPWLQDALQKRAADQQILEAPVEILVLTIVFALACFGALAIVGWIAFHPPSLKAVLHQSPARGEIGSATSEASPTRIVAAEDSPSRAAALAFSLAEHVRREQQLTGAPRLISAGRADSDARVSGGTQAQGRTQAVPDALGSSYRRNTRRVSRAAATRDRT